MPASIHLLSRRAKFMYCKNEKSQHVGKEAKKKTRRKGRPSDGPSRRRGRATRSSPPNAKSSENITKVPPGSTFGQSRIKGREEGLNEGNNRQTILLRLIRKNGI